MKKIVLLSFGLVVLSLALISELPTPAEAHPAEIVVPDHYEKIQWAIGNASVGDTIFVKAGTYYERLTIDKSISLIGEDKYNTIIDGSSTGTVVKITANNVNTSNFTIQNSGSEPYDSGLYAVHSTGNNISSNIIINNGYGIYLYDSSNNVISGNNASNNNEGIGLWYSSNDNTINENIITSNTHWGIEMVAYSSNNRISGNIISDNCAIGGASVGFNSYCDNNIITDNEILNNRRDGIVPWWYCDGNVIGNNKITSNNGNGIWLGHSDGNTIANNNITGNNYEGICADNSDSNTISGNTITSNNFRGIYLIESDSNILDKNSLSNNAWGIRFQNSSDNVLIGNTVSSSDHSGIVLHFSCNNTFTGNTVSSSDYSGIVLVLSSNNNTISGNTASNNGGDGILLGRAVKYNVLTGNTVSNNTYGIWNYYSSDNTIYHNNFINNTNQVYNSMSNNNWDNGYPSGGNYWSEHVCAGNPSDGSQPYIIDANNIDHYPFQDPNGWINTLTIYSSPTGVTFTVDGVSRTTPWSGTYSEGTSVSLAMPEIHTFGDARYYWSQWGDENTSRLRTVTMTTNITLTAYYTGPYYELTVTSSPITGITFIINGTPQTTLYTEWLLEGSYTLEMPETHNGYVWSHWLEDGDPNRIKTVTMDTNIALTAVFTPPDTTPPTISILSPENKTYPVKDVPLTFTVSESTSWIGYSLDGQMNVTISVNTTIVGLSDGAHTITVYANDTAGNTGASEIIYFSIKTKKSEPFPTTWIVAPIVIIAVVGAVLLVYFAKVKKTTGKVK